MLHDLFYRLNQFRNSFEQLRPVRLPDNAPPEIIASLHSSSNDVIGAAFAVIDAYKEHLAWWQSGEMEINSIPDPIRPVSHEKYIEIIQGKYKPTRAEAAMLIAYEEAGKQHFKQLMTHYAVQNETGYLEQSQVAQRRFSSSIKSFAFFGRSLQDNLYRFCLASIGQNAGKHSSMARLFKNDEMQKNSPISDIIVSAIGYHDWFPKFRYQRNRIKSGVGGSFVGPKPDLGIGYKQEFKNGEKIGPSDFRVSDVCECLTYSSLLMDELRVRSLQS